MEVYTLDSLYRRENVIDKFESLIWTERFSAFGDFQLTIPSTLESRRLLASGTKLAMNESHRVMTIETTENRVDADGTALYTVKGRSLENVLNERIAAKYQTGTTIIEPKWILTGAPADVARTIFDTIIRDGTLSYYDKIALLVAGSMYPPSTIGEPVDEITAELPVMTVYSALKQICDPSNLGFRLVRNFDTMQLYFDVYAGSDRTSSQTTLPVVIFSPDLDNLQNATELATTAEYKNCAYVFSPAGTEYVFPLDVPPTVADFERKVMYVLADDIAEDDPFASAKMIQRGQDALATARKFAAFDGELNQNAQYKYGLDYNLGDLVEMRNSDGVTNNMQVVEQIFVSDREGERSYPTLSLNQFITPGSWLSWDFNQVWADFVDEHWAELP